MDACEWSGRGDTWPDEQLSVDGDGDDGTPATADEALAVPTPVGNGQWRQASLLLRFLRLLHHKLLQMQGKAGGVSTRWGAPTPDGDGAAAAATAAAAASGACGPAAATGGGDPAAIAAVGGDVEALRRTSRSAAKAYERLRRVAAASLAWHLRQSGVAAPQRAYITRHVTNIYLH
eukprot:TRINITY_DN10573_c0_g1_i1.p2 TRINITY_DN10573_c0_g1~~TRINITY_DN10573_c0_g1_i1.p2  ORF type:complete len:185 (-),score=75.72 TRINITY_DN10573_c0_g1_i1:339-866(-)